jgi:hypothetical protein
MCDVTAIKSADITKIGGMIVVVGTAKSRMAKETSHRALVAEITACVELKLDNPTLSVATAVKKQSIAPRRFTIGSVYESLTRNITWPYNAFIGNRSTIKFRFPGIGPRSRSKRL